MLIPVTVHVPLLATVAVTAGDVLVPSVATTETVSPAVPVPLAEVLVAFELLTSFGTVTTATVGTTVSFVVVRVAVAVLPALSLAVAV